MNFLMNFPKTILEMSARITIKNQTKLYLL